MRKLPGYLMAVIILLISLSFISKSYLPLIPAILIQLYIVFTEKDPLIIQRKILAFFIYIAIEVIFALIIFGIVSLIRLM